MIRHQLHTDIDIDAPVDTVWAILTDLERYAEWNPFIVESQGTVRIGERLTNRLQQPGGKARTFRPVVAEVQAEQVFEWLGRLGVPGLFDGRHRFELSPTDSGTRLTHTEHFTGLLVPLLRSSLDGATRDGFLAMNEAIKARAEASLRASG